MTAYLVAAALTVVIEVAFYACVRCRGRDFFVAAVLVNLSSNLLLNAVLATLPTRSAWALGVGVGEVLVVVGEWLVLRLVWERGRPGLLWRVGAANALSVGIGFVVMPLVG